MKLYIKKNMSISRDPEDRIAEVDVDVKKEGNVEVVYVNGLRYIKDEVMVS